MGNVGDIEGGEVGGRRHMPDIWGPLASPIQRPSSTRGPTGHRLRRLSPAPPLLCLHRVPPLHKPRSPSTHPIRRRRPSCLVEVEARGIDSAPALRLSPQPTDPDTIRSAPRRSGGCREPSQFRLGSMRRRPGIAGLQNAAATRDQFRLVGENVAKVRTDVMKEQLATFRTQLEEFARKHKNDIRKNPLFRQQFHEMCAKVGVDPLASNKGAWAELLGIGDFYYELGVQIVDICIATRATNGGLIDLLDLRKLLCQKRKADLGSLTSDDCLRAIIISVGKKKLVRSVPTELNKDHNGILELAQAEGFVTVEQVERKFSWSTGRAIDVLETLLKEGLAMIDDGHRDGKRRYWFPCVTLSSDSTGADAKSGGARRERRSGGRRRGGGGSGDDAGSGEQGGGDDDNAGAGEGIGGGEGEEPPPPPSATSGRRSVPPSLSRWFPLTSTSSSRAPSSWPTPEVGNLPVGPGESISFIPVNSAASSRLEADFSWHDGGGEDVHAKKPTNPALPPPLSCHGCSPLLLVSLYPSFAEALFHPRLRRLHRFRLPWGHHLPPSRYTLLYAHGFLVTATTAANNYPPRLLLLRLFTGEQLRLPRVFAPFSRVILTADLLVVIFLPGRATVQHCRPGDALWRVASAPAPHVFDDLISVNGTLYALVGLRLATLQLSESSLELSFLGGEHDDANRPEGDRFMLGECGGEVLLISVEHEERVVYRVFRWASEKRKWEMITNLGGRSLFLGLDGFAACVDQDHPGVRGDCLYAAGRRLGEWHEYSLADGTCDVCNADYPGAPPMNNSSLIRPSVWIFPSFSFVDV
uniref:KIB1-4 beta-propeller domain-containing protein n=2 Tax=Oryza TaxID=4527 RepID=A0A0E0IMQ0_ORYNI